tara:strand:+ start:410 stop:631 length:222 start_codon:yes stop_codon:yes gene_type:complete
MKSSEIAVLLGAPKGKGEDMGEESESGDAGHEAFKSAAESAMRALENGNSSGFAENLKDAIEICMGLEDKGEY